jgi:hypothetical protein
MVGTVTEKMHKTWYAVWTFLNFFQLVQSDRLAVTPPRGKGKDKGSAFFLGGRRGTRTPKHFVNLAGESKNFKMLGFPLNHLQTYCGYLCGSLCFI